MNFKLKTWSLLTALALTLTLSSFVAVNHKEQSKKVFSKKSVDETIDVYTGLITGANDVRVHFDRSGNDAGLYDVTITYKVRFNEGTSGYRVETFTKTMGYGDLTAIEHIQGPNPTAWAEVIEVSWTY